jgi:hypothetical protein
MNGLFPKMLARVTLFLRAQEHVMTDENRFG